MKDKKLILKVLPLFLMSFLIVVFFYKFFLYGLLAIPADLIVGGYYPWLSYKWGYLVGVPVKNPVLSDAVSLIYPIKELVVELIKSGELPLWNWYMFAGYPLLANLQIGILFPTMLFYFLFSAPIAWSLQVAIQPFLSMVFMYLFLRHLDLNKMASLFGAISFGFGGFSMIWLEWNCLSSASSFLPLLLYLTDKFLQTQQGKWLVFFSFALALQILSGYPQLVVFSLISVFLWILIKITKVGVYLKMSMFMLLGIGLSSIVLLPGFELFLNSQRKVEVIDDTIRFLPWQNLIALLAPDFFGNHSTNNFWGVGNYTLMTIYSGAITFILALVSVFTTMKNKILYFIVLNLLALLIITPNIVSTFLHNLGLWGGPAATPTRATFLINFGLSSLAAFGISKIGGIKISRIIRIPVYTLLFLLTVGVVLFVSKYLLQNQLPNNFNQEDYKFITVAIKNFEIGLRNLVLPISLTLGSAILILLSKKIPTKYIQFMFILILILELFRFGWKFNSFSESDFLYPETPITKFLQMNAGSRALTSNVIPANMWLPFRIESPEGYDALYPLTWARFISAINSNGLNKKPSTRYGLIDSYNNKLLDLTSTKYVLALKRDKSDKVDENGEVDNKLNVPRYRKIFEDKGVAILENRQYLARAFLVTQVEPSRDDEVIKKMLNKDFLFSKKAFVSDFDKYQLKFAGQTELPVPEYERLSNNHVRIKTSAYKESFMVVLDSFYPGWDVYVDKKPTKLFRANLSFRGVVVPAGKHQIDFVYYPRILILGIIVTIISFFVLIIFFFANILSNKKT